MLVGLGLVLVAGYIYSKRRMMKSAVESIKAAVRIAKGESRFRIATIGHRNVVVQTDAVLAAGSAYGVASRNGLGYPTIFVEEALLYADINVQKFIVAHEEGHLELHMEGGSAIKHLISNQSRPYKALFGAVDKRELEADLYAAKLVGVDVAIRGLEGLRAAAIERLGKGMHIKEVNNRIKALRAIK